MVAQIISAGKSCATVYLLTCVFALQNTSADALHLGDCHVTHCDIVIYFGIRLKP